MNWPVVARRDAAVLRADRSTLLFPGCVALLAAAVAWAFTSGPGDSPLSTGLALLFVFAVPLTAATVTHEAIPSAVASGRARLTLSLPHSRAGFLVGAGAARLAVTLAAVAAAVLVGSVVYAVRGGALAPVAVLAVALLGALLAAAFVGVTLALTAGSTSTTLAAASTYAFFVLALAWPLVVNAASVLAAARLGVTVGDAAANAAILCSPVYAYGAALGYVGVDAVGSGLGVPPWVGVLALGAWPVLGVAVANWRFRRLDV